ncbi:MAG: response regulator, partial [Candidatus Eremiobacterota bacterium]
DDEKNFRKALMKLLTKAGYEVMEASDGREGIILQKERAFDLVITDIIMPEKEGIETIIELRKSFPDLKIIAMSGGGSMRSGTYLEVADALGADCTIEKPFSKNKILSVIKELIG